VFCVVAGSFSIHGGLSTFCTLWEGSVGWKGLRSSQDCWSKSPWSWWLCQLFLVGMHIGWVLGCFWCLGLSSSQNYDGSITCKGLHTTYVDLLMAFYWWCQSYVEGQCIPSYSEWAQTTRADFLCFLENDLWRTGEVLQFTFPIVGVLPGTLIKVLSRLAVPLQPPPVRIKEISPTIKEQGGMFSRGTPCSSNLSGQFSGSCFQSQFKNPLQ